ncbi:MAG TPA: DUF72 domain-containing protein [Burkholderiaceae bacterium]|nr:DUF72 domain-containing protein [Burkholderiaceae bacterium]
MAELQPEARSPDPVGRRGNVRVGVCSWSDSSLIKSKAFYPRGTGTAEKRLRYYAQQFPVVEVDSSFYAIPTPENSVLWAQRTPENFVFNLKAFRLLTGHQTPAQVFPPDIARVLPPLTGRTRSYYYESLPPELLDELWRRFIEALAPLRAADKLLAVHFQFAPWATNSREWRAHVEECVQRMAGQLLSVEFRNATWLSENNAPRTLAWLRELGVAHTVVDGPQGVGNYAQGVWEVTNPCLAVVRLHGRNVDTWSTKGLQASSERFNYEYRDAELDELSTAIEDLAERTQEVVALLNVNYEDQGVRAARALTQLLQRLKGT